MISPTLNRAEWLEERRSYLGGTDVAAIVGKNKYASPLSVYESKVIGKADSESREATLGTVMEPYIRQWFTDETGIIVHPAEKRYEHPDYPFLAANPDGLLEGRGIWECKTHGFTTAQEWGEEGTDDVPDAYHVQCVWYLGLTGQPFAFVTACDRGTLALRHYRVDADPEYFDALVQIAAAWWEKHIVGKVPPPPSGHPEDEAALRRMHPNDNGEIIQGTPELDFVAEDYLRTAKQVKALEKTRDGFKAQIIAAIGDALGVATMHGTFTFPVSAKGRRFCAPRNS